MTPDKKPALEDEERFDDEGSAIGKPPPNKTDNEGPSADRDTSRSPLEKAERPNKDRPPTA